MKIRHLLASLTLVCTYAHACNFHQGTDFFFVTEQGSLDVYAGVIEARQADAFGTVEKQQQIGFSSFQIALTKPNKNKIDFAIFEAINGHYSDVTITSSIFNPIAIQDRQVLLEDDDLVLISETDVLDALARGVISWTEAQEQDLVRVNGAPLQVAQLNTWLAERFAKL